LQLQHCAKSIYLHQFVFVLVPHHDHAADPLGLGLVSASDLDQCSYVWAALVVVVVAGGGEGLLLVVLVVHGMTKQTIRRVFFLFSFSFYGEVVHWNNT
jgi:hypothetical protein